MAVTSGNILIIHDIPEIVSNLLSNWQQLPTPPKILLADSVVHSNEKLNFTHIPIEPTNLISWKRYIQSEEYKQNPVLSNVDTILILSSTGINPDLITQQILLILRVLISECAILKNKPEIWCEVYDQIAEPLLQENSTVVLYRDKIIVSLLAYSISLKFCKDPHLSPDLEKMLQLSKKKYKTVRLQNTKNTSFKEFVLIFILGGMIGMVITWLLK